MVAMRKFGYITLTNYEQIPVTHALNHLTVLTDLDTHDSKISV